MAKKSSDGEVLRCSFCNKDQNDVRKLIAGPTVFICDECVDVCNDIIADDNRSDTKSELRSSLYPFYYPHKAFHKPGMYHSFPPTPEMQNQARKWMERLV